MFSIASLHRLNNNLPDIGSTVSTAATDGELYLSIAKRVGETSNNNIEGLKQQDSQKLFAQFQSCMFLPKIS